VGLTPQLLPAIININLAKGSQAMAERGVIVRRLESIVNFGSMDVLCTDKTGTITQGVVKLDGALDAEGRPSDLVALYAYLNASMQTGLPNPLAKARPITTTIANVCLMLIILHILLPKFMCVRLAPATCTHSCK